MAKIGVLENQDGHLVASDDVIEEQGYLVARGVRPMAIIGKCRADQIIMLNAATRLETLLDQSVIPFVLEDGTGWADCGCAAAGWVVDLYGWLVSANQAEIPSVHRERIIGLLLGYSSDAVRLFEDRIPRRPDRLLTLWSNPGEVVLTPFMGVGSEIYSAVRNGRKGIGIELKGAYYHQAVKNLESVDGEEPAQTEMFEQPTVLEAMA